jgi:predicted phosphodiesterase
MVRRIRGAHGNRNRAQICNQLPRDPKEAKDCQTWGAVLPDADDTGFQWHDLPREPSRYLILSDLHVPYHDKIALATALEHAQGNCDGLLLNGDIVDAYQLSNFCRDPRRRGFVKEVDAVNQFLDSLGRLTLKQTIFKMGNHEYRLERYLMQRAPELPGLCEEFSYRKQFKLDERGIMYIPAAHPIRHGQLTIIHGHEWGNRFSSPVNQARGAFLKAHDCTLEGHGHRSSYHSETSLTGRVVRCWSVGCLCSLSPEYRPLGNKWDHGFAYLNTGSDWSVENHTIIDGKVF